MAWFGAELWFITTAGNTVPCSTPGVRRAKWEMEDGLREHINEQQRRKQQLWWGSGLHQFLLRSLLHCQVKPTLFVRINTAVRDQFSATLFVTADLLLQPTSHRYHISASDSCLYPNGETPTVTNQISSSWNKCTGMHPILGFFY